MGEITVELVDSSSRCERDGWVWLEGNENRVDLERGEGRLFVDVFVCCSKLLVRGVDNTRCQAVSLCS